MLKKLNIEIRLLILLTIACVISAQSFASEYEQALTKGKDTFIKNCSICHGESATGDGIFAELLNIPTANLTQLSKLNDNRFPYKEIYLIIDGREQVQEHGNRYMPIWGERFNKENWQHISEKHADTIVRGKIFELMLYLESIQE
jgi:mono/diheme cytochrome c family protein